VSGVSGLLPKSLVTGLKRFNGRSKEFLFGQQAVSKVNMQTRSLKPSLVTLSYLPAGRQVTEFEAVYTGLPVCNNIFKRLK